MQNQQDIYQQITDDIIRDLEAGTVPWEMPWEGGLCFPRNAATSADYHGINVLILWCQQRRKQFASSQWLTYRQALSLGGNVKRWEKATRIIYYKPLDVSEENGQGESETRTVPMLRTHAVFNLSQCEGLEKLLEPEANEGTAKTEPELCENAETLVKASGAAVLFGAFDMAFYDPLFDAIYLPARNQFKDQLGLYATMLHELTHWTGHERRLNRELEKNRNHPAYAQEELIAELGASFLCAKSGLPYTTQHAAYIENWLVALKKDKKAIFKAAARAREASEFLLAKLAQ